MTLLVAINAKNIHKSLAQWYIKAQKPEVSVLETDINANFFDTLEKILADSPSEIWFSCYIWNIERVEKLCREIKKLSPKTKIVLGGPEIVHSEGPNLSASLRSSPEKIRGERIENRDKGLGIRGEGLGVRNEYPFADEVKVGAYLPLASNPSPLTKEYFASFAHDEIPIEKRLVYYESTRGCPFSCSYCLSSATTGVEILPLERVFSDINLLLSHNIKIIKFTDRTFNFDKLRATAILEFILSLDTDATFHFEVAADLFDKNQIEVLKRMPKARVQFEIGIQSTNSETLKAINRKTNTKKALANAKTLLALKNCHIHIGLIVGLPHDTFETVLNSLNDILALKPHNLQLGFLKELNGAALYQKNPEAAYTNFPPYQVLKTANLTYADINYLRKIERVLDKFYNTGAYVETIKYAESLYPRPVDFLLALTDFLIEKNKLGNLSLKNSYEILCEFIPTATKQITLDCYAFDRNGLSLPKSIPRLKAPTFDYSQKDPVTNRYKA